MSGEILKGRGAFAILDDGGELSRVSFVPKRGRARRPVTQGRIDAGSAAAKLCRTRTMPLVRPIGSPEEMRALLVPVGTICAVTLLSTSSRYTALFRMKTRFRPLPSTEGFFESSGPVDSLVIDPFSSVAFSDSALCRTTGRMNTTARRRVATLMGTLLLKVTAPTSGSLSAWIRKKLREYRPAPFSGR